jgi:hypothetical protein
VCAAHAGPRRITCFMKSIIYSDSAHDHMVKLNMRHN